MKLKKISALMLAVIMIISVLPSAVSANETAEPLSENWEPISYSNNITTVVDIMEVLKDRESVNWMIIGDSITAPSANGNNANWATMLEHRVKNELGRSLDTFVNVGMSGFSYASFTDYWEGRVAKYNPDVAVVALGTNGNASKDTIKAFYAKLREVNPDIIILPFSMFPQKYNSYENTTYGDRNSWAKTKTTMEAAYESDIVPIHMIQGFIDRRGEIEAIYGNEVLDPANPKSDPKFETMYFRPQTSIMAHNGMPDDLHPDNAGHPLIAKIALKSLGLWDLESSSVCRYIEDEKYTWTLRKSPYVEINKSAIVQKQFPKAYARFMGAYTNGTKMHNSFPTLALVGGDAFSGHSVYIGRRNIAQQIAYIIGARSNMDSKYNNSRVINAGFGGADINKMAELFKSKVAATGSTLVLFMPDFEVLSQPGEAELANYKSKLADVVNTARENGSEIGFVTPPAKGDYTDAFIDMYVAALKQTATEMGVNVIDFNQVMKDTAVNYPNIYKDWYGEDGKANIAMSAALCDCIMDSIGYVSDSGIGDYFGANIRTQAKVRQNQLVAAKQNVGANGEWIISFNIANLNADADAEVYGMLNGQRVEVVREGNTVTAVMDNLLNEFALYYTSEGVKYYTPPFKQYVEYSYDLDGKTYVSIATGSGRTIRTVSVRENLEPKHEVEGHDYTVTRIAANANDAGYTFARKVNQTVAVETGATLNGAETAYSDNLVSGWALCNVCVFADNGKLLYAKRVSNEAQAYAARCEVYELFGISADVRVVAYN